MTCKPQLDDDLSKRSTLELVLLSGVLRPEPREECSVCDAVIHPQWGDPGGAMCVCGAWLCDEHVECCSGEVVCAACHAEYKASGDCECKP